MKEVLVKKDEKKNNIDKLKAIKEVGHTYENAMDNNAKNTKELYEVLKKELETNEHLGEDYRKIVEKEIEAYEKGIDKSTSEEERKIIYEKLEKTVEEAKRKYDDSMIHNKDLRESAIKVDEDNKKFNWGVVVNFGVGVLATIGVITVGTKGIDIARKYIEKK